MSKFYLAVSIKQYSQILQQKNLSPLPLEEYSYGLIISEDRQYWMDQITEQEDLEDILGYQYALLLEIELPPKVINSIIQDKATGRFSEQIYAYYESLGKKVDLPIYKEEDEDVLCILDVYESNETEDGISQSWLLKVRSEKSTLWKTFIDNCYSIQCIGGLPGAKEAAQALINNV